MPQDVISEKEGRWATRLKESANVRRRKKRKNSLANNRCKKNNWVTDRNTVCLLCTLFSRTNTALNHS